MLTDWGAAQSIPQKGSLVLTNKLPLVQVPEIPRMPEYSPGVYKAEPYSMMVVVPGAHLDDRMVFGRRPESQRMPMFTPELRLVPRNAPRLTD